MVIRADAYQNLGGDTVQMLKTRDALRAQGLAVDARSPRDLDDVAGYDIAHVFNIQTVEESWTAFKKLDSAGLPVVFSPIYWDMHEHWFDLTPRPRWTWRLLRRALGTAATRRAFTAWQRSKSPATATWRLQRAMLSRALQVLPNSRSEAALLAKTFWLPRSLHARTTVVSNGIDRALFDPPPAAGTWLPERYGVSDFVLEVGAVSPVKNQLGLIRALYDLNKPIVIVGQPAAAMPEYAEQCKALGAQRGNVIFIERVPHEELPSIYALAAVHVLPSWRETPGLVSLEAAASGCRVVSTSIGSTRDYFGNLVEYCHPADLQSIRAATERALARSRSPALRNHVLHHFTWDRAAVATLNAYRLALTTHHERARRMEAVGRARVRSATAGP